MNQDLIMVKMSTYFETLNLERVAGVQSGSKIQEKWWIKGWCEVPYIPKIAPETKENLKK